MTKTGRKTNFIQALTSGNTLDSIETPIDPVVTPELNGNDNAIINVTNSGEEISKIDQQSDNENVEKLVTKTDITKKVKQGKNNKEFIENLISNFTENTEKTKEKSSLHITPELHYKLKMLAFSTKVNLLDLTNAIIHSYLEQNKENIDAVVKKLTI